MEGPILLPGEKSFPTCSGGEIPWLPDQMFDPMDQLQRDDCTSIHGGLPTAA